MITVKFVTTNSDKFKKASISLRPFEVELKQEKLELQEWQSFDGEEITREKANQAFSLLQEPVIVCDDSWSIPALNGFPGTSMKQCNYYLKPKDWLRLMQGVEDRRIELISYYAFGNGKETIVKAYRQEFVFDYEVKGSHEKAFHTMVISRPGSVTNLAQDIEAGKFENIKEHDYWANLAMIIKNGI